MTNTDKKRPSPDDIDRAERLRQVFADLGEVNRKIPVIIEGKRDAEALRKLGLEGEIITLHAGKGIYEFCEEIAETYPRIVLIMDWDEKGEALQKSVSRHLGGHWEEFSVFRDYLKALCQKEVRDIEGIPGLLQRLDGNINTRELRK